LNNDIVAYSVKDIY